MITAEQAKWLREMKLGTAPSQNPTRSIAIDALIYDKTSRSFVLDSFTGEEIAEIEAAGFDVTIREDINELEITWS